MSNRLSFISLVVCGTIAIGAPLAAQSAAPAAASEPGGYIIQTDAQVATPEPGTHKGGGDTIGYSFFKDVPNLHLVFRKRALKPGSGIG